MNEWFESEAECVSDSKKLPAPLTTQAPGTVCALRAVRHSMSKRRLATVGTFSWHDQHLLQMRTPKRHELTTLLDPRRADFCRYRIGFQALFRPVVAGIPYQDTHWITVAGLDVTAENRSSDCCTLQNHVRTGRNCRRLNQRP